MICGRLIQRGVTPSHASHECHPQLRRQKMRMEPAHHRKARRQGLPPQGPTARHMREATCVSHASQILPRYTGLRLGMTIGFWPPRRRRSWWLRAVHQSPTTNNGVAALARRIHLGDRFSFAADWHRAACRCMCLASHASARGGATPETAGAGRHAITGSAM